MHRAKTLGDVADWPSLLTQRTPRMRLPAQTIASSWATVAEPSSPPIFSEKVDWPMPRAARAAAAAVPAEPAAAAAPDFSLAGDEDRDYLLELENALETTNGHSLFHNMVGEEPHGITSSETGCQRAFDNDVYQQTVAEGTLAYTAGGSLFWLDLRWSSTGVPLRLPVAKRLSKTLLEEPRFYPGALHVAVVQGYSPLNHRGWLHGVSPEEIAHGMSSDVADAVRSEAGNTHLLNAWKRCLLITPFTFRRWALQRNAYGVP